MDSNSVNSDQFILFIKDYVRKHLTSSLGLTLDGKIPSVECKIEQLFNEANNGCGLVYELFLQRFSASVDGSYPPGHIDREKAISVAKSIGGYLTAEERLTLDREDEGLGLCCHGLDPDCCPCGCGDIDYGDQEEGEWVNEYC